MYNNHVWLNDACWQSYTTATFAATGSTPYTVGQYWPVNSPSITYTAANFGVSQAVFTTMNSLTFSMTPVSAENTGGTGDLNWAVANIQLIGVATPTFSPDAGNVIAHGGSGFATVTIACTTPGATIYYTTNGTTPTTASTVYSGSISVAAVATLEAIAVTSYAQSPVKSATYALQAAALPAFSPDGGWSGVTSAGVTITCATSGATIYYTIDGTTPTTSSSVYSTPVTVTDGMTLEAIAYATGYSASPVKSATYLMWWFDSFTSGLWTTGGWNAYNSATITSSPKYTGCSYSGELYGSTAVIDKIYSTVGRTNVVVSYYRYVTTGSTNPQFVADWSPAGTGQGGTSYTTLESGVQSTTWTHETFTLPTSANGNSSFELRFRTTGSGASSSHYACIDDIYIESTSTNSVPAITTQPTAQVACSGSAASFTVAASGSPAPAYQWRKNGVSISGATSATYTITSAGAGDPGSYDCVATNAAGMAISTAVTLTVNAATVITTQPAAQAVCPGSTATFTVAATGTGSLTYQWYNSSGLINGATGATYTTGVADSYHCAITDACGATTSNTAALTTYAAPSITSQPTTQTVCSGTPTTFTVGARGTGYLAYQWYNSGGPISGATSASYTTAAVDSYYCVVTGACGAATCNSVALTISTPTVPTGLGGTASSDTAISLTWTASTSSVRTGGL